MTESTQIVPVNNKNAMIPHSAVVRSAAAAEEIKCMFLASMQFPRNIPKIKQEIIELCQDPIVANEALYSYRKGGKLVEGPSIDLVDEICAVYGRVLKGWDVLEQTETWSKVYAWAIDAEKLNKDERTFIVKHLTLDGDDPKPVTKPRELQELIANFAQRRKRSCMEALIPAHIMNAAVAQVKETLAKAGGKPLKDRIKPLVDTFAKVGVTKEQIDKFVGASAEAMTESQYISLIAIGKSIKEGAPPTQFFKTVVPAVAEPDKKEDKADDKKGKRATKPKDAAPSSESSTGNSDPTPTTSHATANATSQTQDAPPETAPPIVQPEPTSEDGTLEVIEGEIADDQDWSFGRDK